MHDGIGTHGNRTRDIDDPKRLYEDWKYDLSREMFSAVKRRRRLAKERNRIADRNRPPRKRNGSTHANRNKLHKCRTRTRITDVASSDIKQLLTRATCPECKSRMTDRPGKRQKHIDHIIPIASGGTHTLGNLRVICRTCNLERPHDGSDLNNHQPTIWSTDPTAAQIASVMRATRPRGSGLPHRHKTKARGKKLAREIKADLAYLCRLRGASWSEISQLFGFSSSGHAHNVVYGGDRRRYAPARERF